MKKILILFILVSNWVNCQNLFDYIEKGKVKKVANYLSNNQQINDSLQEVIYVDNNCYYPLPYAVLQNQFEIVKLFVKDSLKFPNFRQKLSEAFAVSMSIKNEDISNYLFKLNPDLSIGSKSNYNQNAIMIATVAGNEKWYFKLKPLSILDTTNSRNQNLLHISLLSKLFNKAIFDDIINAQSVNLNTIDKAGRLPLNYALIYNNSYAFQEIMERYPNLHYYYNEFLPLIYTDAIWSGNYDRFTFIKNKVYEGDLWKLYKTPFDYYFDSVYPLEYAISGNSLNIVKDIYRQMLTEIQNTNDVAIKKQRIGILFSILYGRVDQSYEWVITVEDIIIKKNKELFNYIINEIGDFNKLKLECIYEDPNTSLKVEKTAFVILTKQCYKDAKSAFGKQYIKSLFKDNDIIIE